MNRENVLYMRDVMKTAENLDMRGWQSPAHGEMAATVEQLHACGNSACFAGYMAVSPKFLADGGRRHYAGYPMFPYADRLGYRSGVGAVAEWLGISYGTAAMIVSGDEWEEELYGYWCEAEPVHLIAILDRILSGELV